MGQNPPRTGPKLPGDFRLPRELRLCPAEYRTVLSGEHSVAGRFFVIRFVPAPPSHGARFGLIAGRRTFRRAVDRNRARRRIRETFRHCRHQISENCQLVIIARRAILNAPVEALEKDFLRLCRRAGLRKSDDV